MSKKFGKTVINISFKSIIHVTFTLKKNLKWSFPNSKMKRLFAFRLTTNFWRDSLKVLKSHHNQEYWQVRKSSMRFSLKLVNVWLVSKDTFSHLRSKSCWSLPKIINKRKETKSSKTFATTQSRTESRKFGLLFKVRR